MPSLHSTKRSPARRASSRDDGFRSSRVPTTLVRTCLSGWFDSVRLSSGTPMTVASQVSSFVSCSSVPSRQPVDPAVPDRHQGHLVSGGQNRHHRGAHSLHGRMGAALLVDPAVGQPDRGHQPIALRRVGRLVGERPGQVAGRRLDHELADGRRPPDERPPPPRCGHPCRPRPRTAPGRGPIRASPDSWPEVPCRSGRQRSKSLSVCELYESGYLVYSTGAERGPATCHGSCRGGRRARSSGDRHRSACPPAPEHRVAEPRRRTGDSVGAG